MPTIVHRIAGMLAALTIAVFFTSTVIVGLAGSPAAIAQLKRLIVMPGLFILVPAIAATGASGFALARARGGRLVQDKRRRMPLIAAIGLLVLLPSAIVLARLAAAGDFGALFVGVQALELAAGAVNLALMGLNIRDGMKLSGRLRPRGQPAAR